MTSKRRTRQAARQLFQLCLAGGVLDATRVQTVARKIAASQQRGSLSLLVEFQRLVRLDRDRHTARVESATPLGAEMRQAVEADLGRVYGPALTTIFSENPALIGGMRITVGSDVYDDSVRARLAGIAARL